MGMGDTILKMSGIQKYFPGVHALDDAYLEVRAGEVMALVGENGAGKSTLMKILTGIYPKDGGTIEYFGQEIEIHGPKDAQDKGICIVHQELNLMQDLTVAENIFIGREPSKGPFLDQAAQNRMTEELFSSLNLRIPVRTQVKRLTVAKQQMVEIAKALSYKNTKVLIMDEPSTALTTSEIEDLFKFIRQLKATGVGIIYISHRMDELKQITDRITVMRDGQYVDTVETAGTTIDQVVQMMVGRVIYEEPKSHSNVPPGAEVVLEAEHLVSNDVKDVSFRLRRGEILGFAGLMGAGRTETMRLLCGADKLDGGTIKVRGREVKIASPKDAVNAGIGYLSEDRKLFGLCLGLSVADNTALPSLDMLSGPLFVDDGRISRRVRGQDPHQDALCEDPDPEPLRRQPAEGGHRQMAPPGLRRADLRRAHQGHRRRRQERDLQADEPAGRRGKEHYHDLLRAAGAAENERPGRGNVRGPGDRRAGHRRGDPGTDHDICDKERGRLTWQN